MDLDGRAEARGAALAVGGGEEALSLGFEEIEAIGDGGEVELAGAAGSSLEGFQVVPAAGYGLEVNDGAGKGAAGGPIQGDTGDHSGEDEYGSEQHGGPPDGSDAGAADFVEKNSR